MTDDPQLLMEAKDKKAFAEYICRHDQGILEYGGDTDIDVAERAWEAACSYKNSLIEDIKGSLENLRYHTFAHALYYFEKKTGESRESITHVKFAGGHGYTTCNVKTENKTYYISEEMEAAFLLDWARSQGWDIYE